MPVHHSYACPFPEGCNCGASRHNSMEEELTRLRAEVARLESQVARKDCRVISHRIDGGEAWLWQGDGEDHLESLTCPVVIRPEQLRAIFKANDLLKTRLMDALGITEQDIVETMPPKI